MPKQSWGGVMPALLTEMHHDGSLDLDATAKHIEHCLDAGVSGFIMLGTLGENLSLSSHEKDQVIARAVQTVNGRVPVIVGIAEYTPVFAIDTIRRVEAAGCDGLMILPSMVYHQDSREAIDYFGTLAQATSLPIMIYNNPVAYNLDLSAEDFLELSVHENIVAVKESSHDSRRMTDMVNVCGERYLLFCGVDDRALENFVCGAVGWVSGMTNAFPRESVQLFNLVKSGKMEEAVELYRWIMPVLHLDVGLKLVQYIKLASQMTGLGSEWVRAPRLPLAGAERDQISTIIQDVIDSRP
ncbi:MAG: dihydrodipicolinate synthase/N-acetylneuraminate lyase [Candidatus Azotimanducaceae bacterium]|jgi:4-hydroxy-tetrahydrodipicolinate synthase